LGIELGLVYEPYGANGLWYEMQLKIARKLIFSKWKEGLGGNLDLMVSGSVIIEFCRCRNSGNGRIWFNRNFLV
jgi:hypothetical protein